MVPNVLALFGDSVMGLETTAGKTLLHNRVFPMVNGFQLWACHKLNHG